MACPIVRCLNNKNYDKEPETSKTSYLQHQHHPQPHQLQLTTGACATEIYIDYSPFSVAQGIFWLSSERLSRRTLHLKEGGRVCTLVLCCPVMSCIDPSVRIVTKSPTVGPLLIFSISLVCDLQIYAFPCTMHPTVHQIYELDKRNVNIYKETGFKEQWVSYPFRHASVILQPCQWYPNTMSVLSYTHFSVILHPCQVLSYALLRFILHTPFSINMVAPPLSYVTVNG